MAGFALFDFDALDEEETEAERKYEEERAQRRFETEQQEKLRQLEYEKQERLRLQREAVVAAELKGERIEAERVGLNGDWAWNSKVLAEAVAKRLEWQKYGIQGLRQESASMKVPLQGVPFGYPLTHLERSMTIERMWVRFIWQRMPPDLLKFECLRREVEFFKDDSQSQLAGRLGENAYGPKDGGPEDVRMELHGVPWTGPLANEQGEFREDSCGVKDRWNESWVPTNGYGARQNMADMYRRDGSVRLGFKICGPRVRRFLKSFPKFSGEPPDADAENWSIFDLRKYFMSNGMQQPARDVAEEAHFEEPSTHTEGRPDKDATRYGPRITSFLESYPSFSGEVPGADAEANWSHFDMRQYFKSNGKTKPAGYKIDEDEKQQAEREKADDEMRREAEMKRREAERRKEKERKQDLLAKEEEQRRARERLNEETRRREREKQKERQRALQKSLLCQDHYRTLGLECNATTEEVKKTYRKLALLHHPDKQHSTTGDTTTFQQVHAAYQAIMLHLNQP